MIQVTIKEQRDMGNLKKVDMGVGPQEACP